MSLFQSSVFNSSILLFYNILRLCKLTVARGVITSYIHTRIPHCDAVTLLFLGYKLYTNNREIDRRTNFKTSTYIILHVLMHTIRHSKRIRKSQAPTTRDVRYGYIIIVQPTHTHAHTHTRIILTSRCCR